MVNWVRTWLRVLMVSLALVVFGSGSSFAQSAPIAGVISEQIEAFKQDDFDRAFSYASPNIQRLFGSSERFGAMVRGGYPMVWRPAEVRFGPLREIQGNLWQRVEVIDQQGRLHLLDYQMKETPNGWKINGVELLPTPDVTA